MNEFDYEVMQKKRIAYSARHKKNGSRSKYVSLPSDNKKMKKEDVKVYKIGEPVSWNEFRSYPHDVQVQYLEWIRDNFGVTTAALSEMFGIQKGTISSKFGAAFMNLGGILPRSCSKYAEKKFKKWLKGDEEEKTVEPEQKEEQPQKNVEEPTFFDVISSCDMTLKGSALKVGQTIYKLFRDQEIIVTVQLGKENENNNVVERKVESEPEEFIEEEITEPLEEESDFWKTRYEQATSRLEEVLSRLETPKQEPKKTETFFTGKVNINTATIEELMAKTGLGVETARCIIAYRNKHGDFKSVSELENVARFGKGCIRKYAPMFEV